MKNKSFYEEYINAFLEENHKINLISKNDEKFIWEKHIYDSLSLELFFDKYKRPSTLLDIGTGGGFPAIPLAITYPDIEITALDSIRKKITAIETLKQKLNIKNLTPICSRVENFQGKYEVVTSRAVSSLSNICAYAFPKLDKNGYFIAYKSKKVQEEITEANTILKKHNRKVIDIINYKLPLDENYERYLVVIK